MNNNNKTVSDISSLNIYQRINAVQKKKIYVKKGDAGHGTGVLYDDLIALLRDHLTEYGILVVPQKSNTFESRQTAKGGYIYQAEYEINYINIDNPQDIYVHIVDAHAMDNGDKAPAKAMTHATKISMAKIFNIESGDNEESREEQKDFDFITSDKVQILREKMCLPSGHYNEVGALVANALKLGKFETIKDKRFPEIMKFIKKAEMNLNRTTFIEG